MVRFNDITTEFREAGAMNGLISLYSVVNEHTFLTKSGNLVQVLSLGGVDHECLDHPELDNISRPFEAAMRIFTGPFRIYQLMLKRDQPELPSHEYPNPAVREAIRSRIEHLRSKADALYSVELFLVVVYEANLGGQRSADRVRDAIRHPRVAISEWMSRGKSLRVLEADLAQAVTALAHKVNSFVVQLRDVTRLELLDTQAAFRVFARLLNYAPYKSDGMHLSANDGIDFQLAGSALECHRNHLLLDDYYVRVLTLKEPPAQTFPNQLAALQELPSNFIAVSEWKREDNFAMRKAINSQRRHHFNSKASLMNYASWRDQPNGPEEMLIDDSEVAHVADLGQNLRAMEIEGHYFGHFSLTIIIYGLDPVRVERAVAECLKVFSTHDAQLFDERYDNQRKREAFAQFGFERGLEVLARSKS